MINYPAIIKWDEEDVAYNVEFPDLPGCLTYGETLEEAKEMAAEALTGYLESLDSRKLKIPNPSKIQDKDIYYIYPDKVVGLAIWLKMTRENRGMTQKEIADKLKIKYQTYQRIENPVKSNPTIKTIIRLEKVFDKEIIQYQD